MHLELLELMIELDFMNDVKSYENLTYQLLKVYFNEEAHESKGVVTIEWINGIIQEKLRIDMCDDDARARCRESVCIYVTIL